MTDAAAPPSFDDQLAEYRKQIDAIDEQLIDLIFKRSKVVTEVGTLKAKTGEKTTPMRPAREAAQLNKLYQRFKPEAFPESAATYIWRHMINGSLSIEGAFQIGVAAPMSGTSELLWMAREYFGAYSDIMRESQPRALINKVAQGQVNIAVLPYPEAEEANPWWLELLREGGEVPKIFIKLPFLPQPEQSKTNHSMKSVYAFAVALVAEEDFGEQGLTAIAMRTETNCSMGKLQDAFKQAGLDAQWLAVTPINEMERAHFVEVRSTLADRTEALDNIRDSLKESLIAIGVIGRYAAPIQ